jgi:NAD(P)-dependent dehydrogenase (short-subunit alcohol dehydrogenase family)
MDLTTASKEMNVLVDKVAIVTGASSGIGRATALLFVTLPTTATASPQASLISATIARRRRFLPAERQLGDRYEWRTEPAFVR